MTTILQAATWVAAGGAAAVAASGALLALYIAAIPIPTGSPTPVAPDRFVGRVTAETLYRYARATSHDRLPVIAPPDGENDGRPDPAGDGDHPAAATSDPWWHLGLLATMLLATVPLAHAERRRRMRRTGRHTPRPGCSWAMELVTRPDTLTRPTRRRRPRPVVSVWADA